MNTNDISNPMIWYVSIMVYALFANMGLVVV